MPLANDLLTTIRSLQERVDAELCNNMRLRRKAYDLENEVFVWTALGVMATVVAAIELVMIVGAR